MQLHQIPLANQSGKAGFRWEFYLEPCKIHMHKELQNTRSLQVCLTSFLCPRFPGSVLKLLPVFSADAETVDHITQQERVIHFFFTTKGEPLLWNPLYICGSGFLVFSMYVWEKGVMKYSSEHLQNSHSLDNCNFFFSGWSLGYLGNDHWAWHE